MRQFDVAGGSTRRFAHAAMGRALLASEREFELARRWRETGDPAPLHELVVAHGRLVVAAAARFRRYGLSFSDLVQEGNLGLMLAAMRFDPTRDVRFSTYAQWWVRSQMQDFVLRNWSIVRTGTTAAPKSLFFNLRRLHLRIDRGARGGPLDAGQRRLVARELGVGEDEVGEMEGRLAGGDSSLSRAIGERGESEAQDLLVDERPDPETAFAAVHDRRMRLGRPPEALAELSPRERAIIAGRRLREEGATLEELGREFGVSKECGRQLERRALVRLRAGGAPRRRRVRRHPGRLTGPRRRRITRR